MKRFAMALGFLALLPAATCTPSPTPPVTQVDAGPDAYWPPPAPSSDADAAAPTVACDQRGNDCCRAFVTAAALGCQLPPTPVGRKPWFEVCAKDQRNGLTFADTDCMVGATSKAALLKCSGVRCQ